MIRQTCPDCGWAHDVEACEKESACCACCEAIRRSTGLPDHPRVYIPIDQPTPPSGPEEKERSMEPDDPAVFEVFDTNPSRTRSIEELTIEELRTALSDSEERVRVLKQRANACAVSAARSEDARRELLQAHAVIVAQMNEERDR